MTDVFKVAEQRTEAGALLRDSLSKITWAPDERGRAVLVADRSGVLLGVAMHTKSGWTLDASLKLAAKDGRAAKDISLTVGASW